MRQLRKLVNLLVGIVFVIIVLAIDTTSVFADTAFIPFAPTNGSTASGTGNGQFICPYYVAVDSDGNVYVSDSGNNRIQKFDSFGNYVTKWGSNGSGNGQFSSPMGITVDSDGNILVVDYINDGHIQKFDPNGNFLARWGSQGYTDGKFDRPDGIAVDSSGNVYVTDNVRKYIQKFDSNGNFLAKYSGPGTADNQLGNPKGIAIDSSDNIYVVDNGNNCIKKFDSEGVFQFKWGSNGTGDGQFNMPYGIATDSSGNVYVVDGGNNRIQKFDSSGNFLAKWGSNGSGIGQFFYPKGMTVDSSGNVFVADYANNRVQALAPRLEATSTIKGQTIYVFGTPSLMLGNVAAGAIAITAEQAADTTGVEPYVTLFDKGDANAVVKVVKYAAGGDTVSFDMAAAYAGEAVTNGDFFIVRLTSTEGTKVVYYKLNVAVYAPAKPVILSDTSGDACVNINWSSVAGATGYNIYRSTTPSSYGTVLASVGGAVTSYEASGLVSGTTYYFIVKAVNSGGESAASNEVSITYVNAAAPVITADLTDKTTVEGTGITLDATATVSDGGTVSYVWYSADDAAKTNEQAIAGATNAIYSPSVDAAGEFYYYCEVTNTNNAVTGAKTAVTTSAVSKITVQALVNASAPVITADLTDKTTVEGTGITLDATATVSDGGTVSYAWYSADDAAKTNEQAITGAISATYSPSVNTVGDFYYYCKVTNTNNAVTGAKTAVTTSAVSKITVQALVNASAPVITADLTDKTTVEGTGITLDATATVSDGGTVSYAWYKADDAAKTNEQAITGAISATYSPSVNTVGDFYYYCKVTNTNNAVTGAKTAVTTSAVSKITVQALVNASAPVITADLTNKTTVEGTGITLDATATVSDGGTVSYVWYSADDAAKTNEQAIAGATNAIYSPSVDAAGEFYYYCGVTNTNNAVTGAKTAVTTSAVSKVTVLALVNAASPVITADLTNKTTVEGTEISLDATATVSDGGTVSYAWYSADDAAKTNEQAIAGAISATYSPSVNTVGDFYYYCKVTNTNNAVTGAKTAVTTSAVSKVTVLEAAPGAPVLESAVAGDEYVNITWSEVVGATGYKIFTSTTSGGYSDPYVTVTDFVYSYNVMGLENGTTYFFVVKATNPGGDSPKSNEVSATPQMHAPGAPVMQSAVSGDEYVNITWSEVAGAIGYKIFSSTASGGYGDPIATVTDSVYGYDVTGLTNGTTYYFVVKATNPGGDSGYSNEISAIPMSVPGAPENITAEAGNRQVIVRFTAPSDNGGSPITEYIVTANPGGKTASGGASPITVTGLTNGITYTFTVKAVNAVGDGEESQASSPVTPYRPSGGDDTEDEDKDRPAEQSRSSETGVIILVNGRPETAASSNSTTTGGRTVTTVIIDDKKVEEKLRTEGNNAVVTIPVMNSADVVVSQLNGQTVKNMEAKEAVLEIKTEDVIYTLPAAQINIDDVSSQIGEQVELKDIVVNITISAPSQDTVRIVEDTANRDNYQIVVPPVEFSITCTNGNKTVEVSRFNGYVERMVAIPEGVDPSRITTGIVLNADGTFSHVPTAIIVIDGKYYAKINSLTNSIYSVIYSPKAFKDVEKHWAKDAVNDMGSRLVLDGIGEDIFEPDRDTTRAEFAATIVRALGLMRPEIGRDVFIDVEKADWSYDEISIAYEYGIISGYGSDEFGPDDKVTREQAIIMIARAMGLTGLKLELTNVEADKLLESFSDTDKTADYAKDSIAVSIKAGIIKGKSGKELAPKDNITRAETAEIIRRLLQASGLI